jgi:hypothetical protein
MSLVRCGVVSKYFCHIPRAISCAFKLPVALDAGLPGVAGTVVVVFAGTDVPAVDDCVVAAAEGGTSRTLRFGAIESVGVLFCRGALRSLTGELSWN